MEKFVFLLPFLMLSMSLKAQNNKSKITLVIHGGAGTILKENMTPEKEAAYRKKLEEALTKGYAVLEKGGNSLDAVAAAIRIMEDSPPIQRRQRVGIYK